MSSADKYLFTIVICLVSVVGIAACVVLFLVAPFALADLDYDEAQRHTATLQAAGVQLCCAVGIFVFTAIILASGRISQIILKVLDGYQPSPDHDFE